MRKTTVLAVIAIAAASIPLPAAPEADVYLDVAKICDFKTQMCVVPLHFLEAVQQANQYLADELDHERADKTRKCGVLDVLPKRRT